MKFHEWAEGLSPEGSIDIGSGAHPKGIGLDLVGVPSIIGNCVEMPFRHGSVSSMTAFQVLSYYPDEAISILREVHRVLKPGGEFVMTVGRWQLSNWPWPRVLRAMSFVDVEPVRGILSYKGWRCRRCNLPVGRDFDDVTHQHRWIPVPVEEIVQ